MKINLYKMPKITGKYRDIDMFEPNFIAKLLKPLKVRPNNFSDIFQTTSGCHSTDFYICLEGKVEIKFTESELMQLRGEIDGLRRMFGNKLYIQARLSADRYIENRIRFFLFSHVRKIQYV